jgi:hypothetical protein
MKNAKDWSLSVNDFQFAIQESGSNAANKGIKTSGLRRKGYVFLHVGH